MSRVMNIVDKHTCNEHKIHSNNAYLSRVRCQSCRQKKVHGYENPDHITNPFGYFICFRLYV